MFAENNGEMVTEWRSRSRGLNVSARSRSRRLSEADTEPRLGVGRQKSLLQCCQHQLFVSDATIFDIGGFAKTTCILFCCITKLVSIESSSLGWKEEIGEAVLFWHSHNGVLAGWSDNVCVKIQHPGSLGAMLGHWLVLCRSQEKT